MFMPCILNRVHYHVIGLVLLAYTITKHLKVAGVVILTKGYMAGILFRVVSGFVYMYLTFFLSRSTRAVQWKSGKVVFKIACKTDVSVSGMRRR